MRNVVEIDSDLTKDHAAQKSNKSALQLFLIGIVIVGFAVLVAYQIFGCSGCYGASWIR